MHAFIAKGIGAPPPAGTKLRGIIVLCTAPNQGGQCVEMKVDFILPMSAQALNAGLRLFQLDRVSENVTNVCASPRYLLHDRRSRDGRIRLMYQQILLQVIVYSG